VARTAKGITELQNPQQSHEVILLVKVLEGLGAQMRLGGHENTPFSSKPVGTQTTHN
jgi:UDP-N-acetylglucosamine enolpyruvyl transferase